MTHAAAMLEMMSKAHDPLIYMWEDVEEWIMGFARHVDTMRHLTTATTLTSVV